MKAAKEKGGLRERFMTHEVQKIGKEEVRVATKKIKHTGSRWGIEIFRRGVSRLFNQTD